MSNSSVDLCSSCNSNPSSSIIPLDINSYDGKLMFAAIISLLLVISFVLLLHAYARWVFLIGQSAHHRRRTALSFSTSTTTTRLHHDFRDTDSNEMDGLDVSIISSIPAFVHKSDGNEKYVLDCVICLSLFEDDEVGRHLPNCNHAFHVHCIDTWLRSHPNCPICRAVIGSKNVEVKPTLVDDVVFQESSEMLHIELSDVVEPSEPPLEVEIEMPPVESNSACIVQKYSSTPPPSPPLPVQLPIGYSIKRILSMGRSEHKRVCPSSSNVNDLNV